MFIRQKHVVHVNSLMKLAPDVHGTKTNAITFYRGSVGAHQKKINKIKQNGDFSFIEVRCFEFMFYFLAGLP